MSSPANPFAATAQGAILSMVIFVMLFALAITRLPPERRAPLLSFFDSMMQAMMVMVSWVLRFAPVGAFTLALGVGLHGGAGAAGAIVQYVLLEVAAGTAIVLAIYPMAAILARISPLRFARAVAPVQVVAASTQSSLACLPAMLNAAQGSAGRAAAGGRRDAAHRGIHLQGDQRHHEPGGGAVQRACAGHTRDAGHAGGRFHRGLPGQLRGWPGCRGRPSFFASVVPICLAMGVPTTLAGATDSRRGHTRPVPHRGQCDSGRGGNENRRAPI